MKGSIIAAIITTISTADIPPTLSEPGEECLHSDAYFYDDILRPDCNR